MEPAGGLAQFLEVRLLAACLAPEICRGFSIVFHKSGGLISPASSSDLSQIHHFLLYHSVPLSPLGIEFLTACFCMNTLRDIQTF